MSDPKEKLEDGVYVLKSAARPYLALQIGDIVNPDTKARKVTVEEVDENNEAQQWRSTYQGNGDFGYGLYTLEGVGLKGYYLADTTAKKVQAELSDGQNLKWWSRYRDHVELRIFLVAGMAGINALSYEGFAGTEVETVELPPPHPGVEGGNWGSTRNIWTPVKVA